MRTLSGCAKEYSSTSATAFWSAASVWFAVTAAVSLAVSAGGAASREQPAARAAARHRVSIE